MDVVVFVLLMAPLSVGLGFLGGLVWFLISEKIKGEDIFFPTKHSSYILNISEEDFKKIKEND